MDKCIWFMEYKRAFGMYTGFIVLLGLLIIFGLNELSRVTKAEKRWCKDAEETR